MIHTKHTPILQAATATFASTHAWLINHCKIRTPSDRTGPRVEGRERGTKRAAEMKFFPVLDSQIPRIQPAFQPPCHSVLFFVSRLAYAPMGIFLLKVITVQGGNVEKRPFMPLNSEQFAKLDCRGNGRQKEKGQNYRRK